MRLVIPTSQDCWGIKLAIVWKALTYFLVAGFVTVVILQTQLPSQDPHSLPQGAGQKMATGTALCLSSSADGPSSCQVTGSLSETSQGPPDTSSQAQSTWATGLGFHPVLASSVDCCLDLSKADRRVPLQLTPSPSSKDLQNVAQALPIGPWVWIVGKLLKLSEP